MSTHPFDLHPLREVTAAAWNEIKKANQPLYADLPMDFKSKLLDTATRVKSGDPDVAFASAVAKRLVVAEVPKPVPAVTPKPVVPAPPVKEPAHPVVNKSLKPDTKPPHK